MTNEQQAGCPKNGCVSELPADPGAHGWALTGETGWWCPLHSGGERYRLAQQRAELDWYDGAIRKGERWIEEETADRDRELAALKSNRRNRKHPDYPEYERRSAQRIARNKQRIDTYTRQVASARDNRAAAIVRQELENESYRTGNNSAEGNSENNRLTEGNLLRAGVL